MSGDAVTGRKGRALALYSSIAGQGFALIRNVVVARLLGPEEFGFAAAIILTIAFLDALSVSGAQNYLIQAKEGDDDLLASFHAITIGRSIATAISLLVLAWPLAAMFHVEALRDSFGLLAIAALAAGLAHGGPRYAQRNGDFGADSIARIAGDAASLAVGIGVALATHSHVAIVWAILARNVFLTVTSHVVTKKAYRLRWSKPHMRQFWSFGWPLLVNGPLLFLSAQADRLFISAELGATALGIYSAIIVLIMSPSTAILRWLGTIFGPPLARTYHQSGSLGPENAPVYRFSAAMLGMGLVFFAGFASVGPTAVHVLYGPKYKTDTLLVVLIGLLQTIRFLRAWPSTISLAAAANEGILASTVVRLVSLPIGYAGIMLIGGLHGLLAGFVLGEIAALALGFLIINRKVGRDPAAGLTSAGVALGGMAAIGAGALLWDGDILMLALLCTLAVPLGVLACMMSVSRGQTLSLVRDGSERIGKLLGMPQSRSSK